MAYTLITAAARCLAFRWSDDSKFMRRHLTAALMTMWSVAVPFGCSDNIQDELPIPADVLGYDVVQIDWPWCEVEIPPVRADFDVCPIEEIGREIEPERVCTLLKGLKDWMENPPEARPTQLQPGDWNHIRSIIVCRWGLPTVHPPATARSERVIHIEADVPERPRLYWAELEEQAAPPMRFGVTHR